MRLSNGRLTQLLVLLSFGALLAFAVAAYQSTRTFQESRRQVIKARWTITTIADLSSVLHEVSNATRGFVITGQESFLTTYDTSIAEVRQLLEQLSLSARDESAEEANLHRIGALIERQIELTQTTIGLRRTEKKEVAEAFVSSGEEKRLDDEIFQLLAHLRDEKTRALDLRLTVTEASAKRAFVLLGIAVVGNFGLVLAVYLLVGRELRRREASAKRIKVDAQRVRELYDKAPCGYFSTDAQGTITAVNETLLRELGYSRSSVENQINIKELLAPASKEEFPVGFSPAGKSSVISTREITFVRRDGTPFEASVNTSLLCDLEGQHISCLATVFDLGERKRAEECIQQLNDDLRRRAAQLEAVNKELEAFAYSVSHDLRAPLRHVNGFVDMLRSHAESQLDEKGRRYLSTISEASRTMSVLIDELLVFSKMGRAGMAQKPVDLSVLVEEVRRTVERDSHGRTIHWVIKPLPEVIGDVAMLRQVLFNLLANAVKYTRHRKEAVIEIGTHSATPEEVVCFVRDNGAGFDMKYVQKLFIAFQRLHSATEFEGTGVGLAIVRRIVQRHGGRTWAEAVVEQGATFYFSLPRIRSAPSPSNHEPN